MASLELSVSLPAQPVMCSFTSVRVFPCLHLSRRGESSKVNHRRVWVCRWECRCRPVWPAVLSTLDPGEGCSLSRWLEPLAPAGGYLGCLHWKHFPWPWAHGSDPQRPSSASRVARGPLDSVFSLHGSTNSSGLLGCCYRFNEVQIFVPEVVPTKGILEAELSSSVLFPENEFSSFTHFVISYMVPSVLSTRCLSTGHCTACFPGVGSFFKHDAWGNQRNSLHWWEFNRIKASIWFQFL